MFGLRKLGGAAPCLSAECGAGKGGGQPKEGQPTDRAPGQYGSGKSQKKPNPKGCAVWGLGLRVLEGLGFRVWGFLDFSAVATLQLQQWPSRYGGTRCR